MDEDRTHDEGAAEEEREEGQEVCPDCGGSGLDLLTDGGGSCPGCFGGYR